MDSLNSMIKKLSPLNIYTLDENTNIYSELYAYSVGINMIFDELDILFRECFIETAESFGLLTREKIFDSGHEDFSVSKRRQMLSGRMSTGEERHTKKGIKGFITSLGVSSVIAEHPKWQQIFVEITSFYLGADRRRYIESEIRKMMPSHQEVFITFGNIDWAYIESGNKSFESLDSLGYTWQSINDKEK